MTDQAVWSYSMHRTPLSFPDWSQIIPKCAFLRISCIYSNVTGYRWGLAPLCKCTNTFSWKDGWYISTITRFSCRDRERSVWNLGMRWNHPNPQRLSCTELHWNELNKLRKTFYLWPLFSNPHVDTHFSVHSCMCVCARAAVCKASELEWSFSPW